MSTIEEKGFTLFVSYEGKPDAVKMKSTNEVMLRELGLDMFNDAISKPELRLVDNQNTVIASMNIGATDWLEATA